MPRRIHLEPHLTVKELHNRYRRATDSVERSRWHFLWLLASGMTATAAAAITGYSAYTRFGDAIVECSVVRLKRWSDYG
jgi:hypothetical protein